MLVVACLAVSAGVPAGAAPPTAQAQAQARFKQGAAYYAEGAYDRALVEYETAYEILPLPEILFNIGQAQRMRGQRQAAISAYQRYVEHRPEGAPTDLARHYIATLQREEDEARAKSDVGDPKRDRQAEVPTTRGPPVLVVATPRERTPPVPVYKRWWVWTIVGVGAVGLGVGLGVGLTQRPQFDSTLRPDLMESALVHP